MTVRQLGTTESWTAAGDHPEPAEDAQSRQCLPEGAARPVAAAPRETPEGHSGASVSSFSGSCPMCFGPRSWKPPYRPPFGRDSRMPLAPPPSQVLAFDSELSTPTSPQRSTSQTDHPFPPELPGPLGLQSQNPGEGPQAQL